MLDLLPFAGCTINNPVLELVGQRRATGLFRALGFSASPLVLSPAAVAQFLKLLGGRNSIPREIWPFCYDGSWHTPSEDQRKALKQVDAVIIEISTLAEYRLGETILNANIVNADLGSKIVKLPGMDLKAVRAWRNALGKYKDDQRREAVRAILANYPADTEEQRIERHVVENVCTVSAPLEAIERCVLDVRKAFAGVPLGLSLHRFQYMSGARAIDWPPELNREVRSVALRLDIPLFDGASLVAKHGNERALAADCATWAPDFLPAVAEELAAFAGTLKRPVHVS